MMADSPRRNDTEHEPGGITELLPKNGLVYSEKASLSEVRSQKQRYRYLTSFWILTLLRSGKSQSEGMLTDPKGAKPQIEGSGRPLGARHLSTSRINSHDVYGALDRYCASRS